MLAFAVAMAVTGAMFIAVGSALQERVAVRSWTLGGGQLRFFLRLVKQPRWLLGAAFAGAGVALHVVALSFGPVSIIQPSGTTGLLFAVITKAVLDRRRIRLPELAGSMAIVVGLGGLLLALPHTPKDPVLSLPPALLLTVVTLGLNAAAMAVSWLVVSGSAKAIALGLAAGVTFGVGSALVGVVGHRAVADPAAVLDWLTLAIVVLLSIGGIAQQHAYRMRRFALAFAMLEISDPVAASSVGVLVLGEPMPETALRTASMGLSAAVIVVGVVVLVRSYAAVNVAEKS
ncbi:DMT family transporter [Saccharomonospora amisosensis]|uniref:DMT family transporter n=1 Tax=Saccharomonospora amisosensis TaxID=1128677 RepID=UPI0028BE4ED6|nr:DMT family transporter [Saccharomonospora amisosensis]